MTPQRRIVRSPPGTPTKDEAPGKASTGQELCAAAGAQDACHVVAVDAVVASSPFATALMVPSGTVCDNYEVSVGNTERICETLLTDNGNACEKPAVDSCSGDDDAGLAEHGSAALLGMACNSNLLGGVYGAEGGSVDAVDPGGSVCDNAGRDGGLLTCAV